MNEEVTLLDDGEKSPTPLPPKKYNTADRWTIVSLALLLVGTVVLFFLFIDNLGLVSYPVDRVQNAISDDKYDYFAFALEYRERRLSFALTLRTFITSFGFTVGLIMSTIGGLFILRKATISFSLSGEMPDNTTPAERAKISLATNSPGILFMVGGVIVIVITQFLAIPVGSPEIFPQASQAKCHTLQSENGSCYLEQTAARFDVSVIKAYCNSAPSGDENCQTREEE